MKIHNTQNISVKSTAVTATTIDMNSTASVTAETLFSPDFISKKTMYSIEISIVKIVKK